MIDDTSVTFAHRRTMTAVHTALYFNLTRSFCPPYIFYPTKRFLLRGFAVPRHSDNETSRPRETK